MFKKVQSMFIVTFVILTTTLLVNPVHAGLFSDPNKEMNNIKKRVTFFTSSSTPDIIRLDNGVILMVENPIPGDSYVYSSQVNVEDYYAVSGGRGSYYLIDVDGISMTFKNTSNQVRIIRWRESSINVNNYSGIPFLDGMKYIDANTSATPDTLLAPGQTLSRYVYLPRVDQNLLGGWLMTGEHIPKDGTLNFVLLLKIVNESGNGKYYTVNTPPIGLAVENEASK